MAAPSSAPDVAASIRLAGRCPARILRARDPPASTSLQRARILRAQCVRRTRRTATRRSGAARSAARPRRSDRGPIGRAAAAGRYTDAGSTTPTHGRAPVGRSGRVGRTRRAGRHRRQAVRGRVRSGRRAGRVGGRTPDFPADREPATGRPAQPGWSAVDGRIRRFAPIGRGATVGRRRARSATGAARGCGGPDRSDRVASAAVRCRCSRRRRTRTINGETPTCPRTEPMRPVRTAAT